MFSDLFTPVTAAISSLILASAALAQPAQDPPVRVEIQVVPPATQPNTTEPPVINPTAQTLDLNIQEAAVNYVSDLQLVVFQLRLAGQAGGTAPATRGSFDRAPVLAYLFPTSLKPGDVGFDVVPGTVTLAITSHPDFDNTPLWDENIDGNYKNDGAVYQAHWMILTNDQRVPGGLAVREVEQADAKLPPTSPEMDLYLDSPGFGVVTDRDTLRVLVPIRRINNQIDFRYDAATAYLEMNTSDPSRPRLGVYRFYSVLGGELNLGHRVAKP